MAWKITVYKPVEDIIVFNEDEADEIMDREYRINGNRVSMTKVLDSIYYENEHWKNIEKSK